MDNIIIPTIDWRTHNINTTATPTTHELHPTGLEWFMTCPYRYKFDKSKPSENWRNAFYTWDIAEQLMTAYQYWDKLWDEVLRVLWNSTEHPEYQMFFQFAKLRKDLPADSKYKTHYPLYTQKRMTLRILMDADQTANNINLPPYHEIYLTWTADRVFSDYTIWDCKTAKSKWWKNEPDFKLQWRLYPRMRRITSNLPQLKKRDDFDFTYFVWTKQKTPQLQIIELNYKYEDSERLIYHLLTEYIKAYDNDEFNPKKCLACKRCPLREQCPLYWEDWMTSFNATPWIDNNSSSSEEWEWRF